MSRSIGEVAELLGVSVDTLRYYEKAGLADPPPRDGGGRRRYRDDDVAWLQFMLRMRSTGMSVQRMHAYAAARRLGPATSSQRRQMLQQHRAEVVQRIAHLTDCLAVVDHKIENYARMEADLAAAHQHGAAGTPDGTTRTTTEEVPA